MLSLFNRKPYRNIEKSLGKYNLVLKNDLNLSISNSLMIIVSGLDVILSIMLFTKELAIKIPPICF